jgi:nucleotide-binding universal stress UspA family protein
MTTAMPPARFLHLVVGYDGSPPASRALDAAVRLLQNRTGRIDVVYVAHLSSLAALSADAIPEVEKTSTRSGRTFAPKPPGRCAPAGPPGSSNAARASSPIS